MRNIFPFLMTILIGACYPYYSFSQTNFKEGYVIDLHKDTIRGYINYYNWNKNPRSITFKTTVNATETAYIPEDIVGFSVAGERYISGIVTIDISPFRENELTESESPQYRTDTAFLQVLIDGRKKLFSLTDENLKTHFIIDLNGVYETLLFKKYLKSVYGAMSIKTNEKFRGQLLVYFQDCPAIQKKISYVSYNRKDLINLFDEYYKLINDEILYKYNLVKYKIRSEFGLMGGLSLTNVKFYGSDYSVYPIINANYPWSKNFIAGAFYNIILPQLKSRLSYKGKWSINNELIYTSYKIDGLWIDYTNENIYTNWYSTIGASFIKLNNLLKFSYPIDRCMIFVDGGISNGFSISLTDYLKEEDHVYSNTAVIESQALAYMNHLETGLILGLGSNIKNFSCEVRFERTNGMQSANVASRVTRGFVILGYRF
jgi:hypothetical protein